MQIFLQGLMTIRSPANDLICSRKFWTWHWLLLKISVFSMIWHQKIAWIHAQGTRDAGNSPNYETTNFETFCWLDRWIITREHKLVCSRSLTEETTREPWKLHQMSTTMRIIAKMVQSCRNKIVVFTCFAFLHAFAFLSPFSEYRTRLLLHPRRCRQKVETGVSNARSSRRLLRRL